MLDILVPITLSLNSNCHHALALLMEIVFHLSYPNSIRCILSQKRVSVTNILKNRMYTDIAVLLTPEMTQEMEASHHPLLPILFFFYLSSFSESSPHPFSICLQRHAPTPTHTIHFFVNIFENNTKVICYRYMYSICCCIFENLWLDVVGFI